MIRFVWPSTMSKKVPVRLIQMMLCCGLFVELCRGQGLSVIGPKVLRPQTQYTVVVSNTLEIDVRLKLLLEGPLDDYIVLNKTNVEMVRRGTDRRVTFKVGGIPNGDYKLTISSMDNSVQFFKDVDLIYNKKTESILVQLDKPIYKPGDEIRFRIIVIDIDTKPVTHISSVNVILYDGKNNSIMHWANGALKRGVFESKFQIASAPVLGKWKLKTIAGNSEKIKSFELKEYVLPKYYIKVYPAEVHIASRKQIKLIVETSYTFGRPVKGTLTVELFIDEYRTKPDYTTIKPIDGRTTVEFDLGEEVEIDNDEPSKDILSRVTVMESFSNRVEAVDEKITVYRDRYDITMSPSEPKFRPGKTFAIKFTINDRYKANEYNKKSARVYIHENGLKPHKWEWKDLKPNDQGEITVEFVPSPTTSILTVQKVIYGTSQHDNFPTISASHSKSKQFLKISLNLERYKIRPEEKVRFEITCTEEIQKLSYIFISRGRIIDSGMMDFKSIFTYRLPKGMAPKAKIVVMYMKDYLIFDEMDLYFERFDNNFKFEFDRSPSNDYKPGQEVYVDFTAAEDSYVGFHGIDEGITHLGRTSHLLTSDDLIEELNLYKATDFNEYDPFHTMGLFLLTNVEVDFRGGDKLIRSRRNADRAVEVPPHIRNIFTETWLWNSHIMDSERSEIQAEVPDSLTTWMITGFALSPSSGLAIVKKPLKLKANLDFFIVANLPYSIKRDEVAVIQATVFQKLGTSLNIDVKLYCKNDEIDFLNDTSVESNYIKRTIFVENDNGKSVSFFIKAKKLGEIAIKIAAFAGIKTDAVEHILRVIPESQYHKLNEGRFIDLDQATVNHNITINIPRGHDPESVKIMFTLDPIVLETTSHNLDSLLLLPSGCCEQSMVKFIPNIVILDYLTANKMDHFAVKNKAISFLKQGYQNQLNCRVGGAFSIFGKGGASVFLTAFIAKSMKIAAKYIEVDKGVVDSAFSWLANQQQSDGRFTEDSGIYMAEMQGGVRKTCFALTAYVLAAFLETEEIGQRYQHVVERSIRYLTTNFDNMNHAFDLAVTSYAMSLSKTNGPDFLEKLMQQSIMGNNTRYWEHPSVGVEIAGYALLAKLNTPGHYVSSTPIMRWLNTQRSSTGAFRGTQETFIGLKALAKFMEYGVKDRNEYTVRVRGKTLRTFSVDRNVVNLQQMPIDSSVRLVNVEIYGRGTGYFQISYEYYRSILIEKSSFNLKVDVLKTTTYDELHLYVCIAFISREQYEKSNMAVVEVAFPSGIVATQNAVEDLSPRKDIQKTELRYGGTSLVVYYENLDAMEKCFKVSAERRFRVAMHRPAYVVAYDYYNHQKSDRFAIKTYEGKVLQPCELCEGKDCQKFSCN